MKKEVRLGRKERAIAKTARERQVFDPNKQIFDRANQTRKLHKKATKERSASVKDLFSLFEECGVPEPAELIDQINKLIEKVRNDGIENIDFAARIFDPEIVDLTSLPIGLLCHKEEALPVELVPQSRADLHRLCRRMIVRNEDVALIDLVVAEWPGEGSPKRKLDDHVTNLWRLSHVAPELYRAIVCGQHGEVILALRENRLPTDFEDDSLILMLVRHGLLWCTNDIQLIFARNAVAEHNPIEALISSDKIKLEPTRVVNDLRSYYTLLKLLLALYVTTDEQKVGREEPSEVPDDDIANGLKTRLKHHAATADLDLMSFRSTLDQTIPYLSNLLKRGGKRLRQELEKPPSADDLEKSFHAIWFTGLSNVQSAAVPLLRYLQAETELERKIRDLIPQRGDEVELREGVALHAFSERQLPKGWKTRIKDLLFEYRRTTLIDADIASSAKEGARSANAGWSSIVKAKTFLARGGERLIEHHAGGEKCLKRTYYLLDIIPEHRLALQTGMVHRDANGDTFVAARIAQTQNRLGRSAVERAKQVLQSSSAIDLSGRALSRR